MILFETFEFWNFEFVSYFDFRVSYFRFNRFRVSRRIMDKNKIYIQLVWGTLLVLMGIAFFFQIPHSMKRIISIESSTLEIGFVYFCLYLIDLGLLVGGVKKLYANYRLLKKTKADEDNIP